MSYAQTHELGPVEPVQQERSSCVWCCFELFPLYEVLQEALSVFL